MATKAQELKALEQIKKIVAGLGEESYIGKAFEGCFDRAEQNIENDFWDSYLERWSFEQLKRKKAEKEFEELKGYYEALSAKKREMSAEMDKMLDENHALKTKLEFVEAARDDAKDNAKQAQENAEDFKAKADHLQERLSEAAADAIECSKRATAAEAKVAEQELEIMKLKARLFDLIDRQ